MVPEDDIVEIEETGGVCERIKKHTLDLLSLTWPNFITTFIQNIVWLSSSFFVAHLGPQYLAAFALGNMICNASGLSFGIGFSMGLDTVCTQAFGAKKYKLVGLHFQRAIVMLSFACIPIIGLWMLTQTILSLGGVEQEIAQHAQVWVNWTVAGLWPALIFEAFKRYLVAQQIVLPQTISILLVSPSHVGYSYFFVQQFGFAGAALAIAVSNWLWLIVCVVSYLIYKRYKSSQFTNSDAKDELLSKIDSDSSSLEGVPINDYEDASNPLDTWPALSCAIFRGWGEYLKLGIPSSISLALEWGSWEINAFIVARLPSSTIELAAHSVLCNTAGLWYTPALGVSTAVTTCIGNSLGANKPNNASLYYKIAFILVFVYAILNGMASVFYRYQWGNLWTDNPDVAKTIANMMYILWGYGVFDVTKCIGSAVLSACGHPTISMVVFLFSIIFVGYPVSYVLAFVENMGLAGVWIGMAVAWIVAAIFYIFYAIRIDWNKEADDAAERNKKALLSTATQSNTDSVALYAKIDTSDSDDGDRFI